MTTTDQIALASCIIAAIALVVAIVGVVKANHANALALGANATATGQLELALRARLASARALVDSTTNDLENIVDGRHPGELNAREKRQVAAVKRRHDSSLEELLNAYQDACTKYIDHKIDRERLKKDYFAEIRNLFEPPDNAFRQWLQPEGNSRFKALWRVYHEWNDLENT